MKVGENIDKFMISIFGLRFINYGKEKNTTESVIYPHDFLKYEVIKLHMYFSHLDFKSKEKLSNSNQCRIYVPTNFMLDRI